jgi:hypothetical protein
MPFNIDLGDGGIWNGRDIDGKTKNTLSFVKLKVDRASWYAYVRKTNKTHTFLNNLFHLDYPAHVSNK